MKFPRSHIAITYTQFLKVCDEGICIVTGQALSGEVGMLHELRTSRARALGSNRAPVILEKMEE